MDRETDPSQPDQLASLIRVPGTYTVELDVQNGMEQGKLL